MNRNQFIKTKIILIFLTFILISCGSKNHKNTVSRISSVEVCYENGDSIIGQLNYPIHLNEQEIYLKVKDKGFEKIKITKITKVVYNMPKNHKATFEKFKINDSTISTTKDRYQFIELISKGKVNCYYAHNYGFLYKKGNKKKFLNKTDLIFCKRNNEPDLTLIYAITNSTSLKENYLQISRQYFDSQPLIKEKITSENFTITNLFDLITNYNKL